MLRPYFLAQSNLMLTIYLKSRPGASRAQRSSLDFFRRHRKNRRRRGIESASPMSSIAKRTGSPAGFTIQNRKSACGCLPGRKKTSTVSSSRAGSPPPSRFRKRHLAASTNAYRIINGEGDFLPGLIVDRYADFLVCQFFTAGMALFKDDIVEALACSRTQRRDLRAQRRPGRRRRRPRLRDRSTARRSAAGDHYRSRKMAINFSSMSGAGKKPGFFWTSAITARFYRRWRAIAVY